MNIDSMIQGNPQALVTSYNGVLVADSLEVADRFGKRHTHVLRSIDDLINQLESQSTQNWADYFIPDDYQDNKNRTQRRFKLTRDGFSLGRQIILITHNADLAEIGEVSLAVKRSQSGESEVSVL